jgi:hypothetical protein
MAAKNRPREQPGLRERNYNSPDLGGELRGENSGETVQ